VVHLKAKDEVKKRYLQMAYLNDLIKDARKTYKDKIYSEILLGDFNG
jgi:hypothetical protein